MAPVAGIKKRGHSERREMEGGRSAVEEPQTSWVRGNTEVAGKVWRASSETRQKVEVLDWGGVPDRRLPRGTSLSPE